MRVSNDPQNGETLPDTGYWNYLLIFGLRGRLLHYLLTNTNGFGNEIKMLDKMMKSRFGTNEYVDLERELAESFELSKAIYNMGKLFDRIQDIQDPVSKKTLGHAMQIINNFSNDRQIVKEFVSRLNMVDNLDTIFKNPPGSQLQEVKEILANNPDLYPKILSDPRVVSNILEMLLSSLTTHHFTKGAEFIKRMTEVLTRLYPTNLRPILDEFLQIQDPQSGAPLKDVLDSLRNIAETPEFRSNIANLLENGRLQKINEKQKSVMPLLMKHAGLADESSASEPEAEPQKLIDTLTPEILHQQLADFEIGMSTEKAKELLRTAHEGTLFKKLNERLAAAESMDGGLIPENVVTAFGEYGIDVDTDRVEQIMQLMTMLPPELMAEELNKIGVVVSDEDIEDLQQKAAEVVMSEEDESDEDEESEWWDSEEVEPSGDQTDGLNQRRAGDA